MLSTPILLKTSCGDIRGISHGDVNQFLGIKYAYLSDRLARPWIVLMKRDDVLDVTQFG